MKIHRTSFFKNPTQDIPWFQNWVRRLERATGRTYQNTVLETGLGKTYIYTLKDFEGKKESMLIFPGARTTVLFWDLDGGLDGLKEKYNLFLVETNGLPNFSEGNTPDIKGLGYGEWATEIVDKLGLEKVLVAGSSFGGLIAMKMALVCSERIKLAFLLNPGCLQFFSLKPKNLYYNLLPIISPNEANVRKFLNAAVLCPPHHQLSETAMQLLVDYEVFAIKNYKDNTQKPYDMGDELLEVKVPVQILLGDHDLLFPFHKSADNARKRLRLLKEVKVFSRVGHGIETYLPALKYLEGVIVD
jgi:pimeloyl-ACP methyl ester carboxylesterase